MNDFCECPPRAVRTYGGWRLSNGVVVCSTCGLPLGKARLTDKKPTIQARDLAHKLMSLVWATDQFFVRLFKGLWFWALGVLWITAEFWLHLFNIPHPHFF